MTSVRVGMCLICLVLVGGFVFTQTPGGGQGPGGSKPPPSLKLEPKPFRVTLTVKGILAPSETAEISYRPHILVPPPPSQGPLTIRSVVAHGASVKKGDVLTEFDTTKIDEVIADLERDMQTQEASLKLAEAEQPLTDKAVPVELAAANSAKERADDDFKYFLDVDKAQLTKEAEWMLKSAKFYKEYAEEELAQLEKMYKANDLTEETERMVLRRAQHRVQMAIFYYQTAVLDRDHILKSTIPNREKLLKESQQKQELVQAKAQNTLGLSAAQKRAALARLRSDRAKNEVRLAKLREDRAAMTIRAPIAGTAYYGKFQQGRWSGAALYETKLIKGGTIMPEEVFLTVVRPRPVIVHLILDEKDVHLVKVGLQGKAKMVVDPERKLTARVLKVAPIPSTPGTFAADVALETTDADARFMPGMACSVHFVPYTKKDAIAIPSRLIQEEDDRSFVEVVTEGGKTEKREVSTGKTDGERTEIVTGLRAGERVLLERPGTQTAQSKESAAPAKEKGTQP
jgi:multidrug efflux pump subunit AcrA (membrane-fusion protein)